MSYRSLALLVAALTSAQVATADAQTVYVAPGGIYVGAGPVYVTPAPPNGYAPNPAAAPVVVAPAGYNGTNGYNGVNGAQVYVVPAPANGGTQVYVVPGNGNGTPVTAYAATGRAYAAPPVRPYVAPPVRAVGVAPRPPAALPYNGNGRCVVYGRREYCD